MAVQARNVNTLRILYPNECIYPYCALIMEIPQQQEKQIFFANEIGSTLKQENGFIINRCS